VCKNQARLGDARLVLRIVEVCQTQFKADFFSRLIASTIALVSFAKATTKEHEGGQLIVSAVALAKEDASHLSQF
jgi:hypothetical protein